MAIESFVPRQKKSERLTAEQEKEMARRIHRAEKRAREAIKGIQSADDVLSRRPKRAERTRAGMVDRLEEAIADAWRKHRTDGTYRERVREARQAWAEAEALRWELAMSGRRIAHGEARKLAGPFMSEADLVQEGYIGLLRAAKRFDPDRDIRFSTYARWWVRAQMTRAIDHTGRPVRLPGCAVEQTRNLRKAMKRFEAGRPYNVTELAEEVGIDTSGRSSCSRRGRPCRWSSRSTRGRVPFARALPGRRRRRRRPTNEAIHRAGARRMKDAFTTVLTERQQYVLTRRYGLEDGEYRTLSRVGKGMNALARARAPDRARSAARARQHPPPALSRPHPRRQSAPPSPSAPSFTNSPVHGPSSSTRRSRWSPSCQDTSPTA
jgi:RNA polymerase sigma factor (sigma-70 family)